MGKLFSFVLLHYLVTSETIQCANSILENVSGKVSIVIVDNDSPNDSFNELSKYYRDNQKVSVIRNTDNTGYAGGINFGYMYAKIHLNPDFIIAMNNDMRIIQSDFTDKIKNKFNISQFYVLGPDIFSTATNEHQNPGHFSMLDVKSVDKEISHITGLRKQTRKLKLKSYLRSNKAVLKSYYILKHAIKGSNYQNEDKVNVPLHGSCFIFSKLFINHREYALYPKTKMYCEAQILYYECLRDSMKLIYTPEIKILHHEDVATDAVAGSHYKKLMKVYSQQLDSLNIFKELILVDNQNNN